MGRRAGGHRDSRPPSRSSPLTTQTCSGGRFSWLKQIEFGFGCRRAHRIRTTRSQKSQEGPKQFRAASGIRPGVGMGERLWNFCARSGGVLDGEYPCVEACESAHPGITPVLIDARAPSSMADTASTGAGSRSRPTHTPPGGGHPAGAARPRSRSPASARRPRASAPRRAAVKIEKLLTSRETIPMPTGYVPKVRLLFS